MNQIKATKPKNKKYSGKVMLNGTVYQKVGSKVVKNNEQTWMIKPTRK